MANDIMAATDSWSYAMAYSVVGLAVSVLGAAASLRGDMGHERSDAGFYLRTGAACLLALAVCVATAVSR